MDPASPPRRPSRRGAARAEHLGRWLAAHPWRTVALGAAVVTAFSLPTVATRAPSVESAAVVLLMAATGAILGGFWAVSAARRVGNQRTRTRIQTQVGGDGQQGRVPGRRPIEPPV